MMTKTV